MSSICSKGYLKANQQIPNKQRQTPNTKQKTNHKPQTSAAIETIKPAQRIKPLTSIPLLQLKNLIHRFIKQV